MMCRTWIDKRFAWPLLAALVASTVLAGCTTNKEKLLPHGDTTMLDIWQRETGRAGQREMLDARQTLRRSLTKADSEAALTENQSYSRAASNEIYAQFKRLPNPDLVMYVYPHLGGSEHVPVPGYSTVFPLYERVQYAMPGERTNDY